MDSRDVVAEYDDLTYTQRPVGFPSGSDVDQFNSRKERAARRLRIIIKTFYPNFKDSDLNTLLGKKGTEKDADQRKILEDYRKLMELSVVSIPQQDGSKKNYCTLAESAGGVTEKVVLATQQHVASQIDQLLEDAPDTKKSYLAKRDARYKLARSAIIKLPKRGNIFEVQREKIALRVSKLLGFNTTQSTMLSYKSQPALFVPFDNITQLKEFAQGVPTGTKNEAGDVSSHYSTIVPVGERLQSDRNVADFGNTLAFFYLCSDPDAFGGYNQNKALNKKDQLYVFDQVLMSDDRLEIDSRLSLVPTGLMRHFRHWRGRNRTVVDDSSMDTKFAGIMGLVQRQSEISTMLDTFIARQAAEIARCSNPKEKKNLQLLQQDAIKTKNKINQRIVDIFKKFPLLNNQKIDAVRFNANKDVIKHALILEKLVNNPRLFTEDGRPYRHPWTYRNTNTIKNIELTPDGSVQVYFNNKLDEAMLTELHKRLGIQIGLHVKTEKSVRISMEDLKKLQENALFPEHSAVLASTHYLDIKELKVIAKGYGKAQQDKIILEIEKYLKIMQSKISPEDKIRAMEATQAMLMRYHAAATDKGFALHITQKLGFDIQQQLQKMTNDPALNALLTQAFNAAIKLDRVNAFNRVAMAAMSNNYLNREIFTKYLQETIDRARNATDYAASQRESKALEESSSILSRKLSGLIPEDIKVASAQPVRPDSNLQILSELENPEQLESVVKVASIAEEPTPVAPVPASDSKTNTKQNDLVDVPLDNEDKEGGGERPPGMNLD